MFAPKNILVPTDFSEYSVKALKEAVDIAAQHGSKIHLLHVVDRQVQECAIDYRLSDEIVRSLKKESLKTSKDTLEKEVEKTIKDKNIKVVIRVKRGIPAQTILREQKAKKIDLIVIASHGKTGLVKQLMGSVADKVVKGAKCPVMVVKP
ncbi:MAG: universal stress protein [Syntrophales bacterium]|jgi:nucleotide-binding universal stress UspA family protein